MAIKKMLYFLSMGFAFLGSALFWTHVSFNGDATVVFRINTLGITWRYIIDAGIIAFLFFLFFVSMQKFLISVDTRHTTTINRK